MTDSMNTKIVSCDGKIHYLQQKLKFLEENVKHLCKRMENEETYFNWDFPPNELNNGHLCYTNINQTCKFPEIGYSSFKSFTGEQVYYQSDSDLKSQQAGGDNLSKSIPPKKPEVAIIDPKIFFSWQNDAQDFNNKLMYEQIKRALESSPQDVLTVEELKNSLLKSPDVLPYQGGSGDQSEATTQALLVRNYEERLNQIQEKCLKYYESITEEEREDKYDIDGIDVSRLVLGDEELLELKEDMVLDYFRQNRWSLNEDSDFRKIVEEVETLTQNVVGMCGGINTSLAAFKNT